MIKNNPLLALEGLPDFGAIKPEHLLAALDQVLKDLRRQLNNLEQVIAPTWDNIMVPLSQMDEQLGRVWGSENNGACFANLFISYISRKYE